MSTELFRGVVPFVAVAEAGSFRRAAVQLGVSPAAVSKAVRALEQELGATLFVRGARTAALTREGALLLPRCQGAVSAVRDARASIESARKEPQGELVVSVPFIGAGLVTPALARLRVRHPRLAFRLVVTDRLSRLAEEEIDVAVRIGPLADSALVARRLCGTALWTVAAPSYLARAGVPARPSDLDAHACLVLVGPHGKPRAWPFRRGEHAVPATLLVDHGPTLTDAAVAGLGVAQLFDFMAADLVREGKLVRVLEDETAPGPPVHALCAPGRRATARVRAAFDAFADAFMPYART
jgi:DNA-binding transcriptional LysR family regulator